MHQFSLLIVVLVVLGCVGHFSWVSQSCSMHVPVVSSMQIMDKKNRRLQWPSDSEFDEMSLSRWLMRCLFFSLLVFTFISVPHKQASSGC